MGNDLLIEFYKPEPPPETTFDQILKRLAALPDNQSRTLELKDAAIRLRALRNKNHIWEGDLARLRLHEPAFKGHLRGTTEPVVTGEDEGILETNAFLYIPNSNVFVFQKKRIAVGLSRFAYYCYDKLNLNQTPQFNAILTKEALQRLKKSKTIRRLDIKIAKISDVKSIDNKLNNTSISKFLDAAKLFGAPQLSLTLSLGKAPKFKTLDQNQVLSAVSDLLVSRDEPSYSVDKILANTRAEDGELDTIDFIKDRMYARITVTKKPDVEQYFEQRIIALHQVWREHKPKIP